MRGNIAKLYDKNVIKFKELIGDINRNVKKGDLTIDLGCGTGAYINALKNKVGNKGKVVAIDKNREMVLFCKTKHSGQNVVVKKLEAERLYRLKEKANVVFASLVLQFTKPEKSIAEIRKILKPRGKLIFAIPLYRTGITVGIDRQSRDFKSEFDKNFQRELSRIGCEENPSLEYPNSRKKLFKNLLQKNKFKIRKWKVLPLEKNGLKQLIKYYKIPWRSAKITKKPFKKRYKAITTALKKTFAKYPKFKVERYYLIAVAVRK